MNHALSLAITLVVVAATVAPAGAQSGGRQPMPTGAVPTTTSTGFPINEAPPAGSEAVFEYVTTNFGFVPNLTRVMSTSPALANSYIQTQDNLKQYAQLSQAEINIVQMAIAVENKCEYCTAGHTMVGQSFFKTPMEHMQSVRMRQALNDPKLNTLRNFAITVYMKRGEAPQQELDKFLAAGYTRAQALDVVACVAAKVMSNYTNSLAKTPIDDQIKPLAAGLPFAEMH